MNQKGSLLYIQAQYLDHQYSIHYKVPYDKPMYLRNPTEQIKMIDQVKKQIIVDHQYSIHLFIQINSSTNI